MTDQSIVGFIICVFLVFIRPGENLRVRAVTQQLKDIVEACIKGKGAGYSSQSN